MDKDKLGSHFIEEGTFLTDNLSSEIYKVSTITNKGISLVQVTTISVPKVIYIDYDKLESGFISGNISISGYDKTDIKILHLVICNLKKFAQSEKIKINQVTKEGEKAVKKKVEPYRP